MSIDKCKYSTIADNDNTHIVIHRAIEGHTVSIEQLNMLK